jgi:hypothetical protein
MRIQKTTRLVSLGLVAVVAGACGGGSTALTTGQAPQQSASGQQPTGATTTPAATSTPAPARCATSDLSVRLGSAGGAAGSVYEPIVFTNNGAGTCSLSGYPGVSFLATKSGPQVGAPASRNQQHPATSVSLAPGATASAMLQVAEEANYPDATCKPTTVTGLRVYPPGQTQAAYVAFAQPQKACSTQVDQLTVEAVVAGTSGM